MLVRTVQSLRYQPSTQKKGKKSTNFAPFGCLRNSDFISMFYVILRFYWKEKMHKVREPLGFQRTPSLRSTPSAPTSGLQRCGGGEQAPPAGAASKHTLPFSGTKTGTKQPTWIQPPRPSLLLQLPTTVEKARPTGGRRRVKHAGGGEIWDAATEMSWCYGRLASLLCVCVCGWGSNPWGRGTNEIFNNVNSSVQFGRR